MASQQNWDALFKDGNYVQKYTIGEKVTRQYAQALIDQSRLVSSSKANAGQLVVLDNACGTGIISSTLNASLENEFKRNWKLTCGDISPGMLEHTRRRMEQESWPNAEVKTVDARDNGLPSAHYTHAFTAFGYMTIPNSLAALDETCRILRPGGSICFSTWIEPGWASAAKHAIETIPGSLPFPTTEQLLAAMDNGDWHSVPWIEAQLQQRGFEDIKVTIAATTVSLSVPEFVEMIMLVFPMVARYFWTEKQREENEDKARPAVTSYLEGTYGTEVTIHSTAILSTARKPSR